MKNLLVVLVTVGIGVAYWYQMPEPPKAKEASVETAPPPPPPAPVVQTFTPSRTSLDEPTIKVGGGKRVQSSVLLGNDKPSHLHP